MIGVLFQFFSTPFGTSSDEGQTASRKKQYMKDNPTFISTIPTHLRQMYDFDRQQL
jgi:hypothetical protein